MASLIFSDLVVACAFRDKWEFWKPVFEKDGKDGNLELITQIKVSMKDFMYKNFLCENSALGNVFSGADEERITEYLRKNNEFFWQDGKGFWHLFPEAIKENVGSCDLNEFFAKKLSSEAFYEKWMLQAFNFYPNTKTTAIAVPDEEELIE